MSRRILTTLAWWLLCLLPMGLVLLSLTYDLISPSIEALPEVGLWRREQGRILSDEWLTLSWGSTLLWGAMVAIAAIGGALVWPLALSESTTAVQADFRRRESELDQREASLAAQRTELESRESALVAQLRGAQSQVTQAKAKARSEIAAARQERDHWIGRARGAMYKAKRLESKQEKYWLP